MPFGRKALTWKQLDAVSRPLPGKTDELICQASLLAPHLRETLVEVNRRQVTDRPPLRFQVFQATSCPPFYALLDDHGVLKVGGVDLNDAPSELFIPDFDRCYTEVVSMTPTSFDRRVHGVVDVWIIVRQWPRGEPVSGAAAYKTRAYHAIVKPAPAGRFQVAPSLDEAPVGAGAGPWSDQPEEELPNIVRFSNSACDIGDDLFDPNVSAHDTTLYSRPERDRLWVAQTPGASAWVAGAELRVRLGDREFGRSLPSTGRVRGLAIAAERAECDEATGPPAAPPARLQVAVCQGSRVVAFEVEAGSTELVCAWEHALDVPPRGVAFLGRPADECWPDMLVGTRSGEVMRLRHVGVRVQEGWSTAWGHIEEAQPDQGIEAYFEWIRAQLETLTPQAPGAATLMDVLAVRHGLLRRLVERVFEHARSALPGERHPWIDRCAELLRDEEAGPGAPYPALDYVLEQLRDWHSGRLMLPLGGDGEGDFTPALVRALYERSAPFSTQERIDLAVRRTEDTPGATGEPHYEKLRRAAHDNLDDIWRRSFEDTDALVRQTALGFERWANRFMHTDLVLARTPLGPVEFLHKDGRRWLVVAQRNGLCVHEVDAHGKLVRGTPLHDCGGVVAHLAALRADGGDRLVVATLKGRVSVHELDAREGTLMEAGELPTGRDEGVDGELVSLTAAAFPTHGELYALGFTHGRRSRITLYRRGDPKAAWNEVLHGVSLRSLDLAVWQTGLQVIVGMGADAQARLYQLGPQLRLATGGGEPNPRHRQVAGRVTVTRFDKPQAPQVAVFADRDGFVWAIRLDEDDPHARLRWIYKLESRIVQIAYLPAHCDDAVQPGGAGCFLVVSAQGTLALLDADSGRRLWKHHLSALVQSMAVGMGQGQVPVVAVALETGVVELFRLMPRSDRADGLVRAQALLADPRIRQWSARDARARCRADQQLVAALGRYTAGTAAADELLDGILFRQARAQFLRFLTQAATTDPERLRDVIAVARHRDLALIQEYQDEPDTPWDAFVARRLERPEDTDPRGDNGPRARMNAQVARLRRLGATAVTLRQLVVRRPPDRDLEHAWLRLELARWLVHSLGRPVSAAAFVGPLLDALSELPPPMVAAVATVCGQLSPHTEFLAAARRAVDALSGRGLLRQGDLPVLAHALRSPATGTRFAALCLGVVELIRLDEPDPTLWAEGETQRAVYLSALRRLGEVVGVQAPDTLGMCRLLWQGLHKRLPESAVPDDSARLTDRQGWFKDAQARRLDSITGLSVKDPMSAVGQWMPLVARLLELVGRRVDWIAEREIAHLRRMVRPRVELSRVERGRSNDVHLELLVLPEGEALLADASLELKAVGREGLAPSVQDQRRQRWVFRTYSSAAPPAPVALNGYVRPDQSRIVVETDLQASNDYRQRGRWEFDVPKPFVESFGPEPFPQRLPGAFQRYCEDVFGAPEAAVAAVFDEELGLAGFLHEAREVRRAEVCDLDRFASEYGRDRTYATLTGDDIQGWLRGCFERSAGRPVVLSPTGEFFDRLRRGEWPELLGSLAEIFLNGGRRDPGERLVVVISSEEASSFRAPLTRLAWREAHRVLAASPPAEASLREAHQWLAVSTGGTGEQAAEIMRRLGGDLRLAVRFIRACESAKGKADERHFVEFLRSARVQAMLKRDLSALEPVAVVCAVAGAASEAQLPRARLVAGLVPTSDHVSSKAGPGGAKLIQAAGQPFSERSLNALRSDRGATELVRVEGYGHDVPTVGLWGSRLAALAAALDGGTLQVKEHPFLERAVLPRVSGSVVRTVEPYRTFIRDTYARQQQGRPLELDQRVLQEIRDEPALLLHAVGLQRLPNLPPEVIDLLLAACPESERKVLLDLARLWGGGGERGSPIDVLRRVFAPPAWLELKAGADDCDRALAKLERDDRVRVFARGARDASGVQDEYLVWLPREHGVSLTQLRLALSSTEEEFKRRLNTREIQGALRAPTHSEARPPVTPRLIAMGPGTQALGNDDTRRVALLLDTDLLAAAGSDKGVGVAIMGRVRAKLRLTLLSPYRTTGALPPGSTLFMGRDRELDFIRAGVRRHSILIIGGRRVGKTSLLNQARHWAQNEPDLAVLFIDCQGVGTQQDFENKLWECDDAARLLAGTPPERRSLAALLAAARGRGRQILFLLNEIDELLKRSRGFVASLRAPNDEGTARFVMVGYTLALRELREPSSPLFHFTQGLHHGGKAIALAALDDQPARGLIDLLEVAPLSLTWVPGDKERAYALLLDRSYRIPWVLQSYCHALIARLESERRETISLADVQEVVAGSDDILRQYFDMLDVVPDSTRSSAKPDPRQPRRSSVPVSEAVVRELRKSGIRVVLTAVARDRYFLSKDKAVPAIRDPKLVRRGALSPGLGFTVSEARDIVTNTMRELLVGAERRAIDNWFGAFDLLDAFRELTLTLYLEPDPLNDQRFGFLLHIYPRELSIKHLEADPTLDKLFVEQAVEFWSSYSTTRMESQ